jgi:CO/xanthine dehydrogenase FAD-binding subunit
MENMEPMTRFDYVRAHSLEEAIQLLTEPGIVSKPLAGGTDILVYVRQGEPWFDRLVDVSLLPELKTIKGDDTCVRIGAGVTFAEAIESELLNQIAPFLVEACQSVGSPQIRNLGTLGGNVVNAAPCADSLPPLVCLDAVAHLRGAEGEREVLVSELVTRPNQSQVRDGELLTHFSFSIPPEGVRSAFVKLGRRKAQSISRLSMATMGRTTSGGVVDFVRLTPGAATPRTKRFEEIEIMLLGERPTESLLIEAGEKAAALMVETTGRRWSTEYKEIAIKALSERALRRVLRSGIGLQQAP